MQLVNRLCDTIMSPTSIDTHQSPTYYTTANDDSGSSGSSSCGSVDDRPKHHSSSSRSSSSISEQILMLNHDAYCNRSQPTSSILDDFMLSAATGSQQPSSAPMNELVGNLLHDNVSQIFFFCE